MLLKLLEDQNGEVQNLAVKCLGPLVAKVSPKSLFDAGPQCCTLIQYRHVHTVDSLESNVINVNAF